MLVRKFGLLCGLMAMMLAAAVQAEEEPNAAWELRHMFLSGKGGRLPDLVIVDIPIQGHMVSIMSSVDGGASIYYSTGGARLGGESIPAVRKAAIAFARGMVKQKRIMKPVTEFPFPPEGTVRFHLRSGKTTYVIDVPQAELDAETHPLTPQYRAAVKVLEHFVDD